MRNELVDLERFELSTSSMPWKRAPNCATGPKRDYVYENIIRISTMTLLRERRKKYSKFFLKVY